MIPTSTILALGHSRLRFGWQTENKHTDDEGGDEVAQWLNLVSKAGFSYLMASVKYLRDGQYTVHRIEEDGARDAVSLTTVRIRPVMPGKAPSPPRATPATTGK